MAIPAIMQQPATLIEGNQYFLKVSEIGEKIPVFTQIIFICYASCPAVVIVKDDQKRLFPCERKNIFNITDV